MPEVWDIRTIEIKKVKRRDRIDFIRSFLFLKLSKSQLIDYKKDKYICNIYNI